MKVKAIKTGFYDRNIIEAGTVFEIKEKKVPLWCTLASGEEVAKTPKKQEQPNENKKTDENKKGEEQKEPDENNAKKLAELDMLLTEGIELGIVIDIENKSIQEQIDEIKEKIEQAKQSN